MKSDEKKAIIKNKFKLCESYFNELETIFTKDDEPITPDSINIPKITMLLGKLSIQFSDLETLLEVFGSITDIYKEDIE